ncbi:hypothetical protein Tco_0576338 [Tanacetum coccineum]
MNLVNVVAKSALNLFRERGRLHFTVSATVKKISSTTIDKASINHQKSYTEITDEELREFTSEYYIPSALHPVVPAASASIADFPVGKVGGVRPLRDGEEPLLESTAGRTMELVLEQPEAESIDVLAPTPLRSVPGATTEPPRLDATSVCSSGGLLMRRGESEAGEVDSGTSTEEETLDAPPMLTAKEVTETPPPNVEATSDSSTPVTHAVQSPPQTNPLTADDIPRRGRETVPRRLRRVEGLLEKQEEKLRKLSIEYDEELYPHMLSAIAERRWLISHGLRLAAMSTLESQEVKQSFGDVVKCALARGDEFIELPHIAQLEHEPGFTHRCVPIFACPRDILNPFALEKEIPLKESLEAHAIRLAKKKGVKGKAILCGVAEEVEMLRTKLAVQSEVVVTVSRLSSLVDITLHAAYREYHIKKSKVLTPNLLNVHRVRCCASIVECALKLTPTS